MDSFDGLVHGRAIPRPIVAQDVDGGLLGGLAFTQYKDLSNEDLALWINAVFAEYCFRPCGTAMDRKSTAA